MRARASIQRGGTGGYRWLLARRAVAPQLARWVVDLHGFVERSDRPIRRTEFAVPFVVVILELGPPLRFLEGVGSASGETHAAGFLGGVGERPATMEHLGYQEGLQINLTPPGARLWLGRPLSEYARGTVSLGEILPRGLAHLRDRVAEAPDWDTRFDLVEDALERHLGEPTLHTGLAEWSLARMRESGGGVPVDRLARELGYSRKQLNRIFREWVGVSPKMHGRIVRFERLVGRLRDGTDAHWAELAAALGYYDQSHLARDVRHFARCSPGRLRCLARGWPESSEAD